MTGWRLSSDSWKPNVVSQLASRLKHKQRQSRPVWRAAISNNRSNLDEVWQSWRKVEVDCSMAGGSSTMPKQLEQSVLFEVANVGEKNDSSSQPHNLLSLCQALFYFPFKVISDSQTIWQCTCIIFCFGIMIMAVHSKNSTPITPRDCRKCVHSKTGTINGTPGAVGVGVGQCANTMT